MYTDICIKQKNQEIKEKARELGWQDPGNYETKFLEADDWGQLKRKIKESREDAEIIVFEGGNEKLNRKASSDSRVDVILHPGRGRKDPGIDKVIAKQAAENNVAIGLSLRDIIEKNTEGKYRTLSAWRDVTELCEKYGADYIITTEAAEVNHLRAPRDISSFADSIGFNGKKALEIQEKILEKNMEKLEENHVRGGVKTREE